MTISPKKPLSAFRIISITLFLLIFLSTPENVLQLAWNSTLGGFASKRCPRNPPYAFSLTTFAFNRYPCALLVVIHTRYYCSVLNGFIQLLLSKAISDFTSAASLFASHCFMKISMLRIGSVQIYQQVPRLLKKILRSSATIKIIPRIILANCSYFNAKDFGTPSVPCPSVSLHGWSTGTPQKRVWVPDLDLKSTKLKVIIYRPPDGSPRCGTTQRRMLVNSRHSTKAATIQLQINVAPN